MAPATCAQVTELAHAWLDGELAASDIARLHAHLAACAPCALAVALEVRFARVIRARTGVDLLPAASRERLTRTLTQGTSEAVRASRPTRA